ncbi:hypothetical protein M501DRAFT_911077, partial [Patellaria atrata CBS 101060]
NGAPSSKRRRLVKHGIKHKQNFEEDPTERPQDEAFFQSQLLRALSLNLSAVGFDGAKPSALEMFRGAVEEYMASFLSDVTRSMHTCRRTTPLPQDFIHALATREITPSSLYPHLELPLPPSIVQPTIPPPPPTVPPPDTRRLETVLGNDLSGKAEKSTKNFIPTHFPAFPPKHTFHATPVFAARETDPRKIRELATQEGILAEQALRKLMAAQKSGLHAQSSEKLEKEGKSKEWERGEQIWEAAMKCVIKEDEEAKKAGGWIGAEDEDEVGDAHGEQEDQNGDLLVKGMRWGEGIRVNYEKRFWRKS